MTQIELIDFRLIFEDPQNPRKVFNKESLSELSENIKQQGLLQPITVRSYPTMRIEAPEELNKKPCYKIVMGARRWKACIMAGVKEIPAIIREMTDEEAFDAMITENLQRKDVEPMDEARAFAELHKRGTSFEELAARFGKSVSFIRLRIKLNDLVPELVELLDKKELQISHAQELCKLTPEHQTTLFTDKYSENAPSYYKWNEKAIKDIKQYIQNDFVSLDKAIFDKTECEKCELRCGANALFAEYSENNCTNRNCYDEKTIQHYSTAIKERIAQGYLLVKSDHLHSSMIELCSELEKSYPIIEKTYKNSDWEHIVERPEREEDDTDEEWAETVEEYHNELSDENERLLNGYQKAILINYTSVDEIIIKFKENVSLSTEENIAQQSIKDLQSKDRRNAEIKVEKTVEDLRKLMSESNYETYNYPITDTEKTAMFALMLRSSAFNIKREIEINFNATKSYFENCKLLDEKTKNQIIRSFIQNRIVSSDSAYSKEIQSILSVISTEAFPDDAKRIELKHEDTYLKRKENIDKQIKDLTDANTEIR